MFRSTLWMVILAVGVVAGCGEEFAATGAGAGGQPSGGQGGAGASTSAGGGDAGAGNLGGGGQATGGSGGGVTCGSRTFTEDFSQGATFPWAPWESFWSDAIMQVRDGRLEFHFGYSEEDVWRLAFTTGTPLDLTECSVSVKVAVPPPGEPVIDMELVFFGLGENVEEDYDDSSITLGIGLEWAYASAHPSGYQIETDGVFDPVATPYIRIREQSGLIHFEKSAHAEANSWVPIFSNSGESLATPDFVTAGFIELGAGVGAGAIVEGESFVVAFDDVNLP